MIEESKSKLLVNKAALQNAIEELPYYIELMAFTAKTSKIKYEAYIKEGFTPEQALFLCKDK
jgi:hypothetical protein